LQGQRQIAKSPVAAAAADRLDQVGAVKRGEAGLSRQGDQGLPCGSRLLNRRRRHSPVLRGLPEVDLQAQGVL